MHRQRKRWAMMAHSDVLGLTLELAVPLWIERYKERGGPSEVDIRRVQPHRGVTEHGDDILFASKKKGDTANYFNDLAETIAVLSFTPGGIKAFGRHWEEKKHALTSQQ